MLRALLSACCLLALTTPVVAQVGEVTPGEQNLRDRAMSDLRLYHAMLDAYARGDDMKSVEAEEGRGDRCG